ncbi:MAG: pyridoxamine 5'-phosphate oxidase [Gammaproteobacteria bacterium]|nr:pyridoxamine 5'-phosphate oxidase [Gammaproteobacteria bacterium]
MTADTPFARFASWLAEAEQSEPINPTAMSVATVDARGRPQVRMVLLRGFDTRGFVFYTNLESQKGADLKAHPHAALCFYWKTPGRQVRIDGPVEIVSDAEADAYFASRPRDSQIGAWASQQSRALESRFALEQQVATVAARFGFDQVPRPPFWSGYRVIPQVFEFWEERPFRLHERTLFTRRDAGWEISQLYP